MPKLTDAEWETLLERIRSNDKTLTSFNLDYSNKIGDTGVTELSHALKDNSTLTSLELRNNNIGNVGAAEISRALKDNRTLTSLGLGGNKIEVAGATELSHALKDNCTLISLGLGANKIGDAGAAELGHALKDNRTLTSLGLGANKIGDAGAAELSHALKDNHTLNNLDLGANKIGATGVAELGRALKDNHILTSLDLTYNRLLGDAGIAELGRILKDNCTLTSLRLANNNIEDAEVAKLGLALKDNHTLISLDLSSNLIGAAGATELGCALKNNCTLTSLDLRYNQIGDAGATGLGRALKDNHTLTSLDLYHNQIGDAGATELGRALKDNHTLISLDLSSNLIEDAGATELGHALKNNRTLTILNLRYNKIGDVGAIELGYALKDNQTLISLDLNSNEITKVKKSKIDACLKQNKRLRDELHAAVEVNDTATVSRHLKKGVSLLSTTGKEKNTPLHWAVIYQHDDLVKILIAAMQERGFPLAFPNKKGQSAIDLASGYPEMKFCFEALLSTSLEPEPAPVDTVPSAAFKLEPTNSALENTRPDATLNDNDAMVTASTTTSTKPAVPEDFLCPISNDIMLDPVCDPEGFSYDRCAIENWLKENNVSPMTKSSLNRSQLYPNRILRNVIGRFLKENPQVELTALIDEIKNPKHESGNAQTLERLLFLGASLTATDDIGRTALHWAVFYGETELVTWLIEKGAAINAYDQDGQTPLHLACLNRKTEIAKLMLDKHADITLINKAGETPLDIAKAQTDRPLVRLLTTRLEKSSLAKSTPNQASPFPQVRWMQNLDLIYGVTDNHYPKYLKYEIPANDYHQDLRGQVKQAEEFYQGGEKTNFLAARLGFFYSVIHVKEENKSSAIQKNYHGFHSIEITTADKFMHVSTEYKNNEEVLAEDLERYHPEKKAEIQKHYQAINKMNFYRLFHHSERALFKHLETPHHVQRYVDEFAYQLKRQHNETPAGFRIKAVVLDANSSRYLCTWCEPALFYFQGKDSPFAQHLTKALTGIGFEVSPRLYIMSRYSADQPASLQKIKLKREHEAIHEVIDLKAYKKAATPLILQRDNVEVLGKYLPKTLAPSKKPDNLKPNAKREAPDSELGNTPKKNKF